MENGLGGLVLISPKARKGPTGPMGADLATRPNGPTKPQGADRPIQFTGPKGADWPTRPRSPFPLPCLPRVGDSILLSPKADSDCAAEAIVAGANPSPASDGRPAAFTGECRPFPSSVASRTTPQAEVKQIDSCLPESKSGAAS
ncbi:unnamed protein product [Linum trigynum]|uniref:Uncharacterized protein n=1 Tax=Linum trigynum TaxID=586398 RepID=A0AAV2CU06_9ROSI